jgi:Asp-tRNA(Asn)/Glu-tRNA(Gln) amidotransferase A subunit family amidase
MHNRGVLSKSLSDVTADVAQGAVTSVELAEASLGRISEENEKYNAFSHVLHDFAFEQAQVLIVTEN